MASMVDIAVKKAEAKVKAETLLRQLRQKFAGRVSKRREAQVLSAPLEQLDDWLDRVLSAPDMDSLFGGRGQRSRQPQG